MGFAQSSGVLNVFVTMDAGCLQVVPLNFLVKCKHRSVQENVRPCRDEPPPPPMGPDLVRSHGAAPGLPRCWAPQRAVRRCGAAWEEQCDGWREVKIRDGSHLHPTFTRNRAAVKREWLSRSPSAAVAAAVAAAAAAAAAAARSSPRPYLSGEGAGGTRTGRVRPQLPGCASSQRRFGASVGRRRAGGWRGKGSVFFKQPPWRAHFSRFSRVRAAMRTAPGARKVGPDDTDELRE
eukprot:gene7606-biopygen22554